MRVVIVGTPSERSRLSASLPDGLEVVGEASSLGGARALGTAADAWVVAANGVQDRGLDDLNHAVETLTGRELEVLELLAHGLSNKSIAIRLGISDQTVKFHVASIYGKLGAANRTDAARRALRQGLVSL
jgi:ATP/maltotriose-dependent transcriptional regulator MalT